MQFPIIYKAFSAIVDGKKNTRFNSNLISKVYKTYPDLEVTK